MTIQESFVAKVTPKRVCALAIHPSEQRFLVAAGSTYGYIGIWDLVSECLVFAVHVKEGKAFLLWLEVHKHLKGR